ncbi:MAG: aminopeptidase N, partial [Bacteriovorax sp.]
MKTDTPKVIKLSEYKKPNFIVETIDLVVHLDNAATLVQSKMKMKRFDHEVAPLVLNGEELTLKSVALNGKQLGSGDYQIEGELLTIKDVPSEFTLEIENVINPEANKTLDGLYKSGSIFCTQNEPEGFRRITYYVDRPDNMAKFTTKIIADKKLYPVLLSNGNPIARGDLEGGLHYVTWEDPFKKPSYLYALVAGDLGSIKDTYKTKSGRTVALEIYCDKGNEDKCHHAMESLKKSMKWDEDRFGLEYDLDIYMIVAVDAFNMGAMENKGLNIFNSAYVLANPKTATDANFYGIESVIGHEYFHNWTGNRVTCRDWFQLTLKEGLTVFRDQEFSADMNSRNVERIQSVMALRAAQFAEDAGPTSHPIKPSTYIEINNFYTATVYEKGAEVIRMIQTLLGVDGFRRGMDKYFELFDGQAVRTEDFIHAMSVANNNFDFTQFKNWYSQNGTPKVLASTSYDTAKKQFKLTIEQHLPENTIPGALPFHIPFKVGLVGSNGSDIV